MSMKKKVQKIFARVLIATLSCSMPVTAYADGWKFANQTWQYEQTQNGVSDYVKNQWLLVNGEWYHFDQNGIMQTGWYQDVDGKWYWLDPTPGSTQGSMQTGWIYDGVDDYYLGADGAWIPDYQESSDESDSSTLTQEPVIPQEPIPSPEEPMPSPEEPYDDEKTIILDEKVKAFDPNTEEGIEELEEVYETIVDYWTDDCGTMEDLSDDEYLVVVDEESPLLHYIKNGDYQPEDVIFIPACEFFPTGVSLIYLSHDDSYIEGHEYNSDEYEVIHTRFATLGDIISEDIHVSFDSISEEDPVSFVWIPEYLENASDDSSISLFGLDEDVDLEVGMNYLNDGQFGRRLRTAGAEGRASTTAGQSAVNSAMNFGEPKSIKGSGFQAQNLSRILPIADFSDINDGKIGLDFSEIILYDKDGKQNTGYDRIVVNGEVGLKNIKPEVGLDWDLKISDQFLPQQFIGKLSYTDVRDLKFTFGGEIGSVSNVMKDIKKSLRITHNNKRNVFGMEIQGVDMSNTAVLGAIGFNLGTKTMKLGIKSIRDQSIKVNLAPTIIVMFLWDMSGKVSTTIVAHYQSTSYVEKGINVQKEGYIGNHGTCAENKGTKNTSILGRQINVYDVNARSAYEKNLKPRSEFTITADGTAEFNTGIGAGVGIMMAGIIPAQVKGTVGPELKASLNGSVKASNVDGISIDGEGSLDAALVAKAKADVKLTAKTFFGEPGIKGSWDLAKFTILQANISTRGLDGQVFASDADRDDTNNLKLSGAQITLKKKDTLASTSGERSITADQEGRFHFGSLSHGDYTIKVEKDGYKTYTGDITIGENNPTHSIYLDQDQITATLKGVISEADEDTDSGNNAKLSGAKITLTKVNSNTTKQCTAYTNVDGEYQIDGLPYGLYELTIEKDGYITIRNEISVTQSGVVYNAEMEIINNQYSGEGKAEGQILNALTGYGVGSGIVLEIAEGYHVTDSEIIRTTMTDHYGNYSITLPAGNYTAFLTDENPNPVFSDDSFTFKVLGGKTIRNQNGEMTPRLNQDEIRVVLRWGSSPRDLDSHLVGPSYYNPARQFHVYYSSKDYRDGPDHVNLDVDDTTSYGPETTTIKCQTKGIYRFAVHNYSNRYDFNSNSLARSGAYVKAYLPTGEIKTFSVPNQSGNVWNVFQYNSLTGEITVLNQMGNQSNPSLVGLSSSRAALIDVEDAPLKDYEMIASGSNALVRDEILEDELEIATRSNAQKATDSNAKKATSSNAEKATGSNAIRYDDDFYYDYDEEEDEDDDESMEFELINDLFALLFPPKQSQIVFGRNESEGLLENRKRRSLDATENSIQIRI